MAIFEIKTDLTKLTMQQYSLPDSFKWASGQNEWQQGEWVDIAAGGKIARLSGTSGTASTSVNTFPLYTSSDRADVKFSRTMTVPKGFNYVFETDNYDGTVNVGTLLAVETDGTRGRLTPAATGEIVRAVCEDTDPTSDGGRGTITCRLLDGRSVA